jgi:hypothetical protein
MRKPPPYKLTAPVPLERETHEAVAKLLHKVLPEGDGVEWCNYPAGIVKLTQQQQAAYTRAGLRRGMPDFLVFADAVYGIELKRRGGRLSKTEIVRTATGAPRLLVGQEEMFARLLRCGCWRDIAVCYDALDVLAALDRWHIPHRRAAA